MIKILSLLVIVFMLQGCVALHYHNQKGFEAEGKDFETRAGTIEKGKVHFYSELDIWFPWKMKYDQSK